MGSLLAAIALCAGPTWTADDAVKAFLASSPELAEARFREDSARGDVKQAGLRPNPELDLSAGNLPLRANTLPGVGDGAGLGRNITGTVGLSQELELGGKRGKRVAAAQGALEEAGLDRQDVLREELFALRDAFWKAVLAKEKRVLADQIRQGYAETIRISTARFNADDISKADLDKIALEAEKAELDLADARFEEQHAVQELLRLVGPGAPPTVEVQGELAVALSTQVDVPALAKRALEARADVREARRRVQTAQARVALAEAEAIPNLTVGVQYTHSQAVLAGDNPDVVGLSVGVPLPLFARNEGEVEKAHVELEAAEQARKALEDRVAREVTVAAARLTTAAEKVHRYQGEGSYEGLLAKAERLRVVAEKTFREGAGSLLTFLEAERTYIAARADYLDTLYEHREAMLELDRAMGAAPLPEGT